MKTYFWEVTILILNGFKRTTMPHTLLMLVILSLPITAIGETLYVSDTLRVGIRTEPNNNVPSIVVVKSGAVLEVLQRKGSYTKVRTKSGIEGWVKGAYLSKKMPAAGALKKAKKELKSANKTIAALENKIAGMADNPQPISSIPDQSQKVADLEKLNNELKSEIATLKDNPVSLQARSFSLNDINENILYIILGVFVMLISVGFLLGVSWHKNQIAKRLGGMSI